jgi:hypothetical protein
MRYQPVLVEWDDEPFARKQFVVWTANPHRAGAFALDWLDYVERVGVSAETDVRAVPLDVRLEDAELDAFSPSWGSAEPDGSPSPKDARSSRSPWLVATRSHSLGSTRRRIVSPY